MHEKLSLPNRTMEDIGRTLQGAGALHLKERELLLLLLPLFCAQGWEHGYWTP